MGMFDVIWARFRCPRCKKISWFDLQTKEGSQVLAEYNLGDYFPLDEDFEKERLELKKYGKGKFRFSIDVLGDCPNCNCWLIGHACIAEKTRKIVEISIFEYHVNDFEVIEIKYKKGMKLKKRQEI